MIHVVDGLKRLPVITQCATHHIDGQRIEINFGNQHTKMLATTLCKYYFYNQYPKIDSRNDVGHNRQSQDTIKHRGNQTQDYSTQKYHLIQSGSVGDQ